MRGKMESKNQRFVWVDLEMTGLDPQVDHILEIATIITDGNLDLVAEGPNIAIYQPEMVLSTMGEWCTNQHTKSGLVARVKESKVSLQDAQRLTLDFIKQHVGERMSPMCGNTIYQDRRFLYQWMPELEAYFHYRNLDVSTIKELAKIWAPTVHKGIVKTGAHLALEDIKESIAELKFYRDNFFKLEIETTGQ